MKTICEKCGQEFIMGENGTIDGCDKCQGIERDKHGHSWLPKEKRHHHEEVGTGRLYYVKREDAFK